MRTEIRLEHKNKNYINAHCSLKFFSYTSYFLRVGKAPCEF
ncbi:hypothetical protein HMPREF9554_02919 [Treponema phagedenis F0421]|nr:hypothetical protein HMPREF9554_02919 [Treponema phagedenis F0421]